VLIISALPDLTAKHRKEASERYKILKRESKLHHKKKLDSEGNDERWRVRRRKRNLEAIFPHFYLK
jgi:hypothetical protein